MKKMLLASFVALLTQIIFSNENKLEQPFLEKVHELNNIYQPYVRPGAQMSAETGIRYPAIKSELHLTDEYRPVWEQLYRERLLKSVNPYPNTMRDSYMVKALSGIASTNSIPMLVDVYTKLLEKNEDNNQQKQKEIIMILYNIDDSIALDAIFKLLDLSDKKYGENSPYQKENGMTLREWVWQDRLNPDYLGRTPMVRRERIEKAEKWREKFNTYTNANLSVKNELFMEKARNLSRLPEKRNKNAEVPLP